MATAAATAAKAAARAAARRAVAQAFIMPHSRSHALPAWRIHRWAVSSSVRAPTVAASQAERSTTEPSATVPVPLCRRPAIHEEPLKDLLDWVEEVHGRIHAIRDGFEASDGGPSADLLRQEVTWALDDAVAEYRSGGGGSGGGPAAAAWRPTTWQQLQAEIDRAQRQQAHASTSSSGGETSAGWAVRLRAPVCELRALWRRRLDERAPFQYLLASAHWREHVLAVGPGVLVPRPETEGMVDMAARAMDAAPALAGMPWADLGTGSGALAVGLACLLAKRRRGGNGSNSNSSSSSGEPLVWAVDLSPVAAAYAEANAAACAPPGAVRVARGSWWAPLIERGLAGRVGGVLTNPPYIPRAEMAGLQAEVGAHEPASALDGGPGQGLDALRDICAGAGGVIAPGGYIAIETAGGAQARAVRELLLGSGDFERAAVVDDVYGVARFVEAWRRV